MVEKGNMFSLCVIHMKQIESKALTEHVPFTCSFAYELFIKVLGTVGGRRVRGVSVTGAVMTVLGLI